MQLRSLRIFLWLFPLTLSIVPGLWAQESATPSERLLIEAQQLIQQGNLQEARNKLTRGLKLYPQEANLYGFLGVVDAQEKKYRQAEANFQKAITLAPKFQGPYLNLGRLYQENALQDPQALVKGIEVYRKLLSVDPFNAEALYQTSILYQRQGNYRASLDILARLPLESQSTPPVLALRCSSLAALGQSKEASVVANELLARPEVNEADILSILPSIETWKQDDLQKQLLEGLAAKGLASASTLHQLGLIYGRLGLLQPSRETLERVAQLQPITAALLMELARVAYKQKDNKGSLGYLAHARELEPKNAAIHFFFGVVCLDERLPLEALKSLREAADLDPANPYIQHALGSVLLHTKEAGDAIPHFRKFIEARPADPRGRLSLGVAYFTAGQYENAKKEFEAVAEASGTSATANLYLARIAKQEDDLPGAVQFIEKSLKVDFAFADAYAELGQIRLRQREYKQAETAFNRSIELDPDNYLANLNLLVLYQRTRDPRQEAQAVRFEEVKKKRSEMEQSLLRKIEIRPYE
jgi:tetratricopeptide (TPR) repeat protein